MRSFAFFWRLVPEKGFGLLYPFFDSVISGSKGRVAVFGDGFLRDRFLSRFSGKSGFSDLRHLPDTECGTLFSGLPAGSVAYFWRRNFPIIAEVLTYCDASLMPSTFLETFGLSALESLSLGVPVAGFSKGGIVPFLLDDRLRLPEDSDFTSALEELFDVPDSDVDEWRLRSADVAAEFSKIAFRTRLVGLLPEGVSKILLVTDFVGNIGGIETYVSNLASTLEEFGYEVRTVGREGGFSSKTEKILSTLAAFANFPAKKELHAALEEFRPDAVWCHSVLRRYGAVGLDALSGLSAYKIMTYHDLGYFAPFAAECRQESDVPRPGFGNFIRSAHGFAAKLFAIAKYAKLRSLFARLRDFNLHLVPSDFLLSIVRDRLPDAKVVTLPHYVSFL